MPHDLGVFVVIGKRSIKIKIKNRIVFIMYSLGYGHIVKADLDQDVVLFISLSVY